MEDNDGGGVIDTMKSRKEAFVTGHVGSGHPWEILWVCSSVLWGTWLYSEVVVVLRRRKASATSKTLLLLLELILVGFPVVLAQTRYLHPYGTAAMIIQIAVAAVLSVRRRRRRTIRADDATAPRPTTTTKLLLGYLTLYRSCVYWLTFVAILAVDFPLFPRRFCKTEVAGYGLMDVGAASFVLSSGIASGKAYSSSQKKKTTSSDDALRPLMKAAPLIAIGIARLRTNKELEYQEHVTEYGVHWNFFFTLGVLAVVPTLRRRLLLRRPNLPQVAARWIFWGPLLAILLYQYELFVTRNDPGGLLSFLLTAPRTPDLGDHDVAGSSSSIKDHLTRIWMRFFFANREGILGCIGYCFLHAVGEHVGHTYVFIDDDGKDGKDGDETKTEASASSSKTTTTPSSDASATATVTLVKPTLFAWTALYLTNVIFNLTASRRETNLPFCLWAIAHNLTILLGFQILEAASFDNDAELPAAAVAVNRHGMVSFLVANLLTGLTNLSMATIDADDVTAFAVLLAYLSAVAGAALLLDNRRAVGGVGDENAAVKPKRD